MLREDVALVKRMIKEAIDLAMAPAKKEPKEPVVKVEAPKADPVVIEKKEELKNVVKKEPVIQKSKGTFSGKK